MMAVVVVVVVVVVAAVVFVFVFVFVVVVGGGGGEKLLYMGPPRAHALSSKIQKKDPPANT